MKEQDVPTQEFDFYITKPYGRNLKFKATFTGDARDTEWAQKAKCNTDNSDYFYSETTERQKDVAYYACRAFGRECPVQLPCLIDAMKMDEHWGVRGGLTENERRAFTRKHGQRLLDMMKDEDTRLRDLTIDRNNNPEKYAHLVIAETTQISLLPLAGIEPPEQQSA